MTKSRETMNRWTTKNGDTILYRDLKLSHLKNILKYIESLSEEGFTIRRGGGTCAEDMWYDEDIIYGDDVLKHFNYNELVGELNRRNKEAGE